MILLGNRSVLKYMDLTGETIGAEPQAHVAILGCKLTDCDLSGLENADCRIEGCLMVRCKTPWKLVPVA